VPDERDTPEGLHRFLTGRGTGDVPCRLSIMPSVWDADPVFFEALRERAPHANLSCGRDPRREHENYATDIWGCRWHYPGQHLDGQVVEHPIADWADLADWRPPDVDDLRDWDAAAAQAAEARQHGRTWWGGTDHGFIYLRLTYLRGFQNFMLDVAEGRPELATLRDHFADFWLAVVDRYAELGAAGATFGDDLGHQDTLPIHPDTWRAFLKPAFARVFGRCREHGMHVYLHTDGYVLPIIPDLIEAGVDVLNPQDLVNGLDNLVRLAKGKIAIDLDIDRQSVTVFGRPAEIDAHVRTCIETLGSPGGRLSLVYGAYPGTPKENVAAVAEAMERYHGMWIER